VHVGKTCSGFEQLGRTPAAFGSFSFCRSGTRDAEISVMAAEEGLMEDSIEVPALLLLIGRAPGPEGRPPGEAKSSKSSGFEDLSQMRSLSISSSPILLFFIFTAGLE